MRPEAPATSAPGAENPCYFTSGVVQGCRVTAISGNINGLKPSDFKGFSLRHSDISVYLEASPNLPLGASKFVLFAHCYALCHHIHTGATALSKYVAQPHILNAGWVCWSFADLTWSIAKKNNACGCVWDNFALTKVRNKVEWNPKQLLFFRAQVSTQIETQTKGNLPYRAGKGLLFRAGRAWVYMVQAATKIHIIKRNRN